MIYGVIPAGGIGSRMGEGLPKQYRKIAGKPIIVFTVEKLLSYEDFFKIIVLCPRDFVSYTKELFLKYHVSEKVIVIEGADTRNETLMNSIYYIEENYGLNSEDIILTHDAVRPFVTPRIIRENIEVTLESGAANTVIGAVDTIIESEDGTKITDIPNRSKMYQTQTPQTFRAKKLRDLYEDLTAKEKESLTDAAKIYFLKGEPISLVRGESFNIKLTFPYDLVVAEALIQAGYMEMP